MPYVFDVAAEKAIHRESELPAIEHFIWDLQRHRLIAIGDRNSSKSLGCDEDESGNQKNEQSDVPVSAYDLYKLFDALVHTSRMEAAKEFKCELGERAGVCVRN